MRYFYSGLAAFAIPLLFSLVLSADPARPNFSGAWQMDSAKSQIDDGRVVTLTIESVSDKIKLVRVVREKDGKEVTSKFICGTGGGDCEFDEGDRKAKVSLWYDGNALIVLKTDGPKEDAVAQWKLELAPNADTLTIDLTHIDPESKAETIIFSKKAQ
jgi:hypothetical protein